MGTTKCHSLVTGGAGFIGSHVAKHCLNLGHEVTILDDLSGGFTANLPSQAIFVQGSVTDHQLIEDLFHNQRFDYVYHLAAYAAEGLSHFIRRFNYTNNLIGSVNLINAAVKYEARCFVFASSIAVYGSGQVPMREEQIPKPEDPYGISKYAVELDLHNAHSMFGLNFIIFRPHNVYGEGQNIGDPYRNVIGIFISQALRGEPMGIFGDGSQTRAFSYIDDVAPHIARSVQVDAAVNQTFNIGGDQPTSVFTVAQTVAKAFGREPRIRLLPPRLEVQHAFSSHEKYVSVFGASSLTSLEEGVARMVRWAQQSRISVGRIVTDIELRKNMPASWERLCQR